MPHSIAVFTGNCPLCTEVVDEIEAGKCARCKLTLYNVSENVALAKEYKVRVVPTVIIDNKVRIEGRPDVPFVCDEQTYEHFKNRYPFAK